jgi:hypothetical protein
MKHFDVIVNKHKLEVIIDTERGMWYTLFPKYRQYTNGQLPDKLERFHEPVTIGTRDYSIVFDCDDANTRWNSFSYWDEKKQTYIDTAQGHF